MLLFALLAAVAGHVLGCGQGAILEEKEIVEHPFYIVSVSPELGATNVPPTGEVKIIFSNSLLTAEAFLTKIATGPAHTAGLTNPLSLNFIYSNGGRTVSLSVEGWDNPHGHVQIITTADITDEYGNVLPAGITLWDYGLVGAPTTYTIAGRATGGTAGRTIYVYAATTSEPQDPGDLVGMAVGTANPFDYTIYALSAGRYYIVAVRDEDGSGAEPKEGDYIGTYPSLTSPTSVEVPTSKSGIDFALTKYSTLPAHSISGTVSGGLDTREAWVGAFLEDPMITYNDPVTYEIVGPGANPSYTLHGLYAMKYYIGGYRDNVGAGFSGPPITGDAWGMYPSTVSPASVDATSDPATVTFIFDAIIL